MDRPTVNGFYWATMLPEGDRLVVEVSDCGHPEPCVTVGGIDARCYVSQFRDWSGPLVDPLRNVGPVRASAPAATQPGEGW